MAVRNEKDILEKSLLNYPEVFCDIFNNLVLKGKGTMRPEDLREKNIWSSYMDAEGETREQYRDVLMLWKKHRTHILLVGVENMTAPDDSLFLKIPEYDSSVLRKQLKEGKIKGKVTPAVTIVLYYGYRKWNAPEDFHSWKRVQSLPDELRSIITNYRYIVIDLGALTEEEIHLLKSDFRVVADYLSQMRRTKKYIPENWTLKHPKEVFELLRVMTGTREFEELEALNWKGKEYNMTAYPIGPVEKMRRKMERELERKLLKKDEVIKQKDEEISQRDEEISQKDELLSHKDIVIGQLTKTVIKQFGSEALSILKESGVNEPDIIGLLNLNTGSGSGTD